jgi:hypothetical protein
VRIVVLLQETVRPLRYVLEKFEPERSFSEQAV